MEKPTYSSLWLAQSNSHPENADFGVRELLSYRLMDRVSAKQTEASCVEGHLSCLVANAEDSKCL